MSTYVGTNFSYKSRDFLDERQGLAKTKEDLKNWDIPVPESFELCLDGVWYFYDSNANLEDTGKWVPRISNDLSQIEGDTRPIAASVVKGISDTVNGLTADYSSLDNSMYPPMVTSIVASPAYLTQNALDTDRLRLISELNSQIAQGHYVAELDLNKDGNLTAYDVSLWSAFFNSISPTIQYATSNTTNTYWQEVGTYMLPMITWRVTKPKVAWSLNGSSVVWNMVAGSDSNSLDVLSSSVTGYSGGALTSLTSWVSSTVITSVSRLTCTYNITSNLDQSVSVNGTAYFKFGYKIYTGASDISLSNLSTVTMSNIVGFSSKFTESGTMSATNFDCTGGKYPYILIPSDFYNASYKTYISNNLNSDFIIKDVTLRNQQGALINYKLYRTTYIQTGNPISIEIK